MKQRLKFVLGFVVLVATIGAFAHYLTTHPQILRQLGDLNPWLAVLLLALYMVWFAALVIVLRTSLYLFNKTMPPQENILLNAYSSLVNFFGPGQSGPAFRAVYLKKRHNMRIKDYVFATMLYYGFYAIISGSFFLIGSRPWWQTTGIIAVGIGISWLFIRWYAKRKAISSRSFNLRTLGVLFIATMVQMVTQLTIFYIELVNVHPGTSLAQALTYTGTANFAVFVSLTPGAIGIREAFLTFSQTFHHLPQSAIVAANVIDRSVYILFLGVLFLMTISLHAKDKLQVK